MPARVAADALRYNLNAFESDSLQHMFSVRALCAAIIRKGLRYLLGRYHSKAIKACIPKQFFAGICSPPRVNLEPFACRPSEAGRC